MGQDSAYYFEVLYPFQDAILSRIAPLRTGFCLPDLARLLCTANEDDWRVVRWIEPPPMDAYLGDLHRLGESLIHGS